MRSPTGKKGRINHRPRRETASHAGQRVIELERKRIAQDIHDGVASQLVSLIATLDPQIPGQQRIIGALETSLLELKFIVNSLANQFNSVVDALASLRYRIQPALDRQGITLKWTMEDAPQLDTLTPERSIHVLRIAQEALNNVLQHSGANAVQMSCTFNEDKNSLELFISDNGRGLSDKNGQGNGLSNMKNRARIVAGNLQIRSNDVSGTGDRAGTEIYLTVPLRV